MFLWKNYDSLFFDGFDYLTCDVEQLEIIGKINTGKANTYKEVSAMATCSILVLPEICWSIEYRRK